VYATDIALLTGGVFVRIFHLLSLTAKERERDLYILSFRLSKPRLAVAMLCYFVVVVTK
jgi:hypothetical protein